MTSILKFTKEQKPFLQILPFFTGLITNSSQITDSDFTYGSHKKWTAGTSYNSWDGQLLL